MMKVAGSIPTSITCHFRGSSAMGPQTSTSQDDEGRKCVLLKYFHQLPNRMRIPSSPQGVFEQWMYQILWSDPRLVQGDGMMDCY